MYPKNAASPEPVAIGPVVQISDGAVQTSGCTVRIKPIGVAEGDGAGTTAYSTDGIVLYTPTQAETNYTSFILIAKKDGCIPVSITVVTTASSVPGRTMPADGSVTAAVIADNAIDAAAIASNAITAAKIADGAIDAATFTTGAITAAALAADASAEIIAALNASAIDSGTVGSIGEAWGKIGGINTNVVSVKAKTDNLPSDPADASDVAGAFSTVNTKLDTIAGYIDTEIATLITSVGAGLNTAVLAVKAKTDNLPTDPADQSAVEAAIIAATSLLATAANLAIVAGYLDTEIPALTSELAKVPKSDGTATWNATALASIQSEANDALVAYDPPTNAQLTTALATVDDATLAAIAALNNLSSANVSTAVTTSLTTALTEGYRSTGATGSVRDLLYEVIAHMGEATISGTTKTLKKIDGATTAKTYTLNDGTTPTGITETT